MMKPASSMLRPWSTKRVPWSKPDEYMVSMPAQASSSTAKARKPSKPWNTGARRRASEGWWKTADMGADYRAAPASGVRSNFVSPDNRPCRAPPTCSTCTAFAPRPTRPRRAQMAQRVAERHPHAALVVPAAAALAARGDRPGDATASPTGRASSMAVVGSSLGGFYATYVAGTTALPRRAAEPGGAPGARPGALHRRPDRSGTTRPSISISGPNTSTSCARSKSARWRGPSSVFAVIAKGDEVLDWREMIGRYPGSRIKLLEGSDHALSDFEHAAPGRGAGLHRPGLSVAAAGTRRSAWDNPRHVCIVRRSRQVPRRPRAVGGRGLGAGRARDRQARQGQGRQHRAALREAGPGRAAAPRRAPWPPRIDLDLAWEFAPEGEFGFADLAVDYFRPSRRWRSRPPRCCALFEAPHYFRRAGKGRFKKAPAEIVQQALAAIEKKKAGAGADRRVGRRTGRRRLPGAGARAALQDPVQARQERARIQGRGRGLARHAAAAARPAASRPAPSTRPTSSTGGASCSRTSPRAPAFPALQRAGHRRRAAAGRRAGLLDRRFADHRDRRRAVGAGPGHRHGDASASTSRRRAWRWCRAARSTRWRARACRRSTCRATRSRCCPTTWCEAYTLQEGRDCPAVSLYAQLRRSHAGAERHRDAAGARADRRQPAPRPARRASSRRPGSKTPRSTRENTPEAAPRAARAAVLPVPPREAAEGAARSGARQARELQPARLQLPPRRQRRASPPATSRCRSAPASAARRST